MGDGARAQEAGPLTWYNYGDTLQGFPLDDEIEEIEDLAPQGKEWMDRIRAAQKRCADWADEAERAETAYKGDPKGEGEVYGFNIFHSNVETIRPALYNSTAIPNVRVKYGDKNAPVYEALRMASQVLETVIEAQTDDGALDLEMSAAIKSMEIAGRGLVRVRFDADMVEQVAMDPMTGEQVVTEIPTNERVEFEAIPWRDYLEGPARRWNDVPWIAFKLTILREDFGQFDNDIFGDAPSEEDDKPDSEHTVWEIWDKASRKVWFVHAGKEGVLACKDDPLGLSGFYPVPRPMEPLMVPGERAPIVPFSIYREQAEEVDRISTRINQIIKGLKVRGLFPGNAADIEKLAAAGDNELVVANDIESLLVTGKLDDAIMWWPIDKAIQVVRELYIAREQAKQAVYEITGISDIVRGAARSQETATAQQIKTEWGSIRIADKRRIVERHCRDLFVLAAELIGGNFSMQRIAEVSGEQFGPEVQQVLQGGLKQYMVDVESDSTIRSDVARRRGEMAEFMQGTGAYFQTMAPIVAQAGPKAAAPVIKLYAAFARGGFNLGKTAEDALENLISMAEQVAEQPPQPDPAQEQQMAMAQADMQMRQADMQMRQQKLQMDGMEKMAKHQRESQKLAIEKAKFEVDRQMGMSKDQREWVKQQIEQALAAAEVQLEQDQKRPVGLREF